MSEGESACGSSHAPLWVWGRDHRCGGSSKKEQEMDWLFGVLVSGAGNDRSEGAVWVYVWVENDHSAQLRKSTLWQRDRLDDWRTWFKAPLEAVTGVREPALLDSRYHNGAWLRQTFDERPPEDTGDDDWSQICIRLQQGGGGRIEEIQNVRDGVIYKA